jgi:hypothetical protein
VPLTDTTILEWSATAAQNAPADHDLIAEMLDDQARLVQSVVRAEAENKGWVRQGYAITFVDSVTFTVPGDARTVAVRGRKVRATIDDGYVYGFVLDAAYASNVTTVTIDWDPVVYDDHAFTTGSISISFAGTNITALFSAGDRVEFWAPTTGVRKVRIVDSAVFALGGTQVNFEGDDSSIPLDSDDTALTMKSGGIDATVSEIEFGLVTPDLLSSGWPHNMLGGRFVIEFDGTAGPFAIDLPVQMHNGSYIPQVQSSAIVSGTPPAGAQWTKPLVKTRLADSFEVTLPTTIAAGATVAYDWLILR